MVKISSETVNTFLSLVRLQHEQTSFHRISLDAEKNLIQQIRNGDYHNIHIPPFELLQEGFGLIAGKPEKTYEYFTVSGIALFSRAAVDCGVAPDDAFDLADALLLILSDAKASEDISKVFELAATMFARLVHDSQQDSSLYLVRKAQNYIRRNLFHKLLIEEIAAYVELTPNYLSQVFARQTGMTIHNYIQNERITIACDLLAHTDRPISEIAVYLGFESPSNFSVVFRKWKGITPTQYRNRMSKEVY